MQLSQTERATLRAWVESRKGHLAAQMAGVPRISLWAASRGGRGLSEAHGERIRAWLATAPSPPEADPAQVVGVSLPSSLVARMDLAREQEGRSGFVARAVEALVRHIETGGVPW